MSSSIEARRARPTPRLALLILAGIAGSAAATAVGIASASTFTLRVQKNVHVTNNPTQAFRVKAVDTQEPVAVGPVGYAVYTFQGETTHHLICKKTNKPATNCWGFWPPVSVRSAKGLSKQKGIKGKLGTFRNHRTLQLTLSGHPLYYFMPDIQGGNKHQATGDELKTFGSIWHIVAADPAGSRSAPSTPPTMTTTTTTTTTTTPPPYSYPY